MIERTISILGSTGSIGRQALEVIDGSEGRFRVSCLAANSNAALLEEQALKYSPEAVVLCDEKAYRDFRSNTSYKGRILFGDEGLNEAATLPSADTVLSALVGFAGVMPTIAAIEQGKRIGLANKETLVAAGSIIMGALENSTAEIIPVDSEHSAIFQCLTGESNGDMEKIILTASGGPFRNRPLEEFDSIRLEDALAHPNWSMGKKVTVDSATMMNKGLEVIEAYWLFDLDAEKIEVLIHEQSIIHSMVQFRDGSVKSQMGLPDMKIPIAYSFTYPQHGAYSFPRMDLAKIRELTFTSPDMKKYPCLGLAYAALERGGTAPAILNAANEMIVEEFLAGKIKFTEIAAYNTRMMEKSSFADDPDLAGILQADKETRIKTKELIKNGIHN